MLSASGTRCTSRPSSTAARGSSSTPSALLILPSMTCSARSGRSPSISSLAAQSERSCSSTPGARPDHAKRLGFIGGKMPLHHGPAEGEEGMNANIAELAEMRSRVGDDFWLMWDCWMSLDLDYATRLALRRHEHGLKWIEECLIPDDYWGYRDLKRAVPAGMLVTTGEHESTRHGFRMLLEMECADIIQPDVGWCGGITELLKISALADAHGALLVPHG